MKVPDTRGPVPPGRIATVVILLLALLAIVWVCSSLTVPQR